MRQTECPECGEYFERLHFGVSFCSSECAARHGKRNTRYRRRAHKQTLHPKLDSVNPLRVFRRDGWRCYICGISTPKRLRGTLDDRAPVLEHVVPLAKGGSHSYENVACACLLCNQIKSDKWLYVGLIPKPVNGPEAVYHEDIAWLGKTTGTTTVFERFGRPNRQHVPAYIGRFRRHGQA